MGYSVAGMYIVAMVHGRWIRVVWSTSWRYEFTPRLVAGLAVTPNNASVCLGRLNRAVVHYMINRSSCVFIWQMLFFYRYLYVCYSCPEM